MIPSPRLAVAVLASFLAGGVVPQAGLVTHDHAGAAAAHVHVAPLAPHRHEGGPPHVHAHGDQASPTLALPHHVHTQRPFQAADRAASPAPVAVGPAFAAPPIAPRRPLDRAAVASRSRGPPSYPAP